MTSPVDPIDPRESVDLPALDAWLAGSATASQRAAVQKWISDDPRNAAFVESLRAVVNESPMAVSPNLDRAWAATRARMFAASPASAVVELGRERARAFPWRKLAIAAGVVIAVALGVARVRARDSMLEIATGPGERLTRTLDDGSRVTLNSGSRIRYARARRAREVQLEGEALFEIRHDPAHPFRVMSKGSTITDIGTRFVVRAYPELDYVSVAVTEGRVSLRSMSDSLVLNPDDVGRVSRSGEISLEPRHAASMTSWTTGAIVFTAAPLADIAAELRRHYGVEIRLADTTLGARRLTAQIRNETLTEALDAISIALGLRYERMADTVTLRPKP